MMKSSFLSIGLIACFYLFSSEFNKESHLTINPMQDSINILIQAGGQEFSANLEVNATSKSFIQQFPLIVELEDYAGKEKIFYPNPKLVTPEDIVGAKASKGDIMYYAPWGDIAIFYENFGFANGLISLGHIDSIEAFIDAVNKNNRVEFRLKE